MNTKDRARNFLVHLRLPFQLLLAPFMLFGAALANGRVSWRFVLAFAVLHVAFYGGTTAFNSHYDKDEGPIGGLEAPPPAGPWLLPGSLLLQGAGLVLAFFVNLRFAAIGALFVILGFLYSHPSTRLKGRPIASWLVVMFGQGTLGALSGFVSVENAQPGREAWFGIAAASLIVGGLYPITQIFQLEEDAKRGDRTVALMLGRRGTPWASSVLFVMGSLLMAFGLERPMERVLFGLTPIVLTAGAFWCCGAKDDRSSFRRVASFQVVASSAFAIYAVARMVVATSP